LELTERELLEPLKGPAPDPYKDWDGTAEPAEPGRNVVPRDRVPAGGQNDRAKGVATGQRLRDPHPK
jgi:hypothetical protein